MQLIYAWWHWTIAPLCFGGKSSSKSYQTVNNVDRRIVADGGGLGINADGNVSIVQTHTDLGAISGAIDLAKSSTLETLGLTKDLFAAGLTVIDKAGRQVETQGQLVAQAYDNAKGEATQKNLLAAAALAVVAIVGLRAWK